MTDSEFIKRLQSPYGRLGNTYGDNMTKKEFEKLLRETREASKPAWVCWIETAIGVASLAGLIWLAWLVL